MPTRLWLVRHGKTDNPEQRCYGWRDVPLHAEGHEQMRRCAAKLRQVALAAVATSDFTRTMESARYFAKPRALVVQPYAALREIHFGALEGLTFSEVEARYPATARAWVSSPATVHFPDGECFADVRARVTPWVENWLRRWAGTTTLLVIHSGTMRALVQWMTGCDPHATLMVKIAYGDALLCTQDAAGSPWRIEHIPYEETTGVRLVLQ
ncbi:MAG: histidine phosphatase family protein [Chloracidobacterium sp.]|nr:histidine phosphatase family protein [Chloracidobacterium sp.]MDW8218701.1 histidine phosphatase family protein [Acidobacteriota bacterium]